MSAAKQKGTAYETAVVRYLAAFFPGVHRSAQYGTADRGDLVGVPQFAIECKNVKVFALAQWVDEANVERGNALAQHAAVIHKRRMKGIERSYVTMELHDWAKLVAKVPQ